MKPWKKALEWKLPYAKWFVGGKLNVSDNCLDRHVEGRAQEQGGDHLGRRARRQPRAHLSRPLARREPLRRRAQAPRREEGRHRHHLHADGPRGGGGDARLRAHRRAAQRGLRRLLAGLAARPHQRLQVEGRDHRRRRLSPRRHRRAEEEHRRGAEGVPVRPHRHRLQAHRPGDRVDRTAATSGGTTS